jgi:hypothetical protein
MANVVPVDRERHGRKGWRRLPSFSFVAEDVFVPLTGSEFPQALPAMPIGFVKQAGTYVPVGLTGVKERSNVFVGPSGQWLGNYVPFALRSYPFSLIHQGDSDQKVLAVDEDSGLVVDEVGEGVEKFFEPDGSPSSITKSLMEYLQILERDQAITQRAISALADANLIEPWPLTVPIGNEKVTVSGLHRVNEPALQALDDPSFLKLRRASALAIAYGQLFSMAQASVLTKLSLIKQEMGKGPPPDMLPV